MNLIEKHAASLGLLDGMEKESAEKRGIEPLTAAGLLAAGFAVPHVWRGVKGAWRGVFGGGDSDYDRGLFGGKKPKPFDKSVTSSPYTTRYGMEPGRDKWMHQVMMARALRAQQARDHYNAIGQGAMFESSRRPLRDDGGFQGPRPFGS